MPCWIVALSSPASIRSAMAVAVAIGMAKPTVCPLEEAAVSMPITLPLLSRTTVLVVVLQVLASLKLFDQAYILFKASGGPGGSATPILQYVYETGFVDYRLGYASAISYVFFALIVVIALVQARLTRRSEA